MDDISESIVGWLWGLPLIFTVLFVGLYFTIGTETRHINGSLYRSE